MASIMEAIVYGNGGVIVDILVLAAFLIAYWISKEKEK